MPRNRTKNTPIGTAPCPFKGCEKEGPLFRYRSQTADEKKQRRAGKLYMRCEDHGMTSDQEWLLANATITNEEPDSPLENIEPAADDALDGKERPGKAKTDDQTATAEPGAPASQPQPEPEPKNDDDGWGFFS